MLRGNHECSSLNRIYGFFDECKRRYSVKLWRVFGDCFNCMPIAAIVGDRIICMHGGLSPELESLEQIRDLHRPTEVPEDGLLADLLWSDPEPRVHGWGYNSRGVSYTFGTDRGRKRVRRWPTSKAHISVAYHSFRLIFRRVTISSNGLEAQMVFLECARAEHPR